MNLENTNYFKSLNVTEEEATRKKALVRTQEAYTDYLIKKVYDEAEVAVATANVNKTSAIETINKVSLPVANDYTSPEAYSLAVDAQVRQEEASEIVIEEANKILVGAKLKLKKLIEWGIAKGFETEEN